MSRTCSRCGGSSFHYNRRRMRMECDLCGTPVPDPQQEQQLMQHDRIYTQAMGHLTAGNWEQTIRLLRPLWNESPTETRLYLAVLRAATRDFRDIRMENAASRATASEAWEKLVRLNGVSREMLRYSRQRYEQHQQELFARRNRILGWLFAAAVCSVLGGVLWGAGHSLTGVLCLFGLIGCLYQTAGCSPLRTLRQLTSAVPDYRNNPFV